MSEEINAIIIGAGPSGIAMAHKLRQKLGFKNFVVSLVLSHFIYRAISDFPRCTKSWMV
jgi:thioredoxin reductase